MLAMCLLRAYLSAVSKRGIPIDLEVCEVKRGWDSEVAGHMQWCGSGWVRDIALVWQWVGERYWQAGWRLKRLKKQPTLSRKHCQRW